MLQVVQLDESFIDFWSDALLDPVSSDWPSFVVCKLNSNVVPDLKYGPVEEGRPEKTLQWLVVEQQITVKRPPVSASVPAPEETVEAPPERPSSPQSISKKRFSFWSSSRSISSNSITSTKSKKKDVLKGQRVGEMGEVVEEGETAGTGNGTRSRRRTKAEDVVRVRIPSPKPRKSGEVRSLKSVDVGSPTVVKKPVSAKLEEDAKEVRGESSGGGNVAGAAAVTVAAAGAAAVGTAAPALAAAATVIAVPVAAVAAVAAVATRSTEKEGGAEPERREEERSKVVEDGTRALEAEPDHPEEAKEEAIVVVLDDKAGEPKPVVPEKVLVIPASAIAEDAEEAAPIVGGESAPLEHIDEAAVEESPDKRTDEVVSAVEGQVEEVLAEVQSPPDPEPVVERTITVAQVAVPVIEDDAVVGSIPAVVEEVAEDVHVDSIPAIAPAPAEAVEVASLTEDDTKSKDVEVPGELAVPGMPVQELEPTTEEALGATSVDVAPAPLVEEEVEVEEDPEHVEAALEKGDVYVANGHPAEEAPAPEEKASPEPEAHITVAPSDGVAIEQPVINQEITAPVPEPEVLPVQEEDVATAPEAVVDTVGEEPAPVNTIIGNGSLKELTHSEPALDRLVPDISTDVAETAALPVDTTKPEGGDSS